MMGGASSTVSGAVNRGAALLLLALAASVQLTAGEGVNLAREILQMTGERTKIAFARRIWDKSETNETKYNADLGMVSDPISPHFSLMVFDTNEGHERILVPECSAKHPLITPNGRRVIYDELHGRKQRIWVIDWDGKNLRDLCAGHKSVGVAEDPVGVEWVYIFDNDKIYRTKIDDPAVRETVWDQTKASWFWAFTRDGKYGIAGLPWPNVCVATLPNVSFEPVGGGCGQGLAPDGKRCFHLVPPHNGINMYDKPGSPGRFIDLRGGPDVNGHTIYFPTFAMYDARFISITGPQRGGNDPGPGACVLLGQFDAQFNAVVKWLKVTVSPTFDIGSCVWIQPENSKDASSPVAGFQGKALAAFVKKIDKSSKLKPIVDELQKKVDLAKDSDEGREAQELIFRIEAWGQRQLRLAQETEAESAKDAEALYKQIAVRLGDLAAGNAAQARLDAPEFKAGLKAWPQLDKARNAEREMVDVPGAERSIKNEKFYAKNKKFFELMKNVSQTMQKEYGNAYIIPLVNEILARYQMEPISPKAEGPAPATAPTAAAPRFAPWPSQRKDLVFLWETAKGQSLAFDAAGKPQPACMLVPRGLARQSRNFGLWLENGAFLTPNAEKYLLVQKNQEITLEACIFPSATVGTGVGEILSLSNKADDDDFVLGQRGNQLVLHLRTSDQAGTGLIELCDLTGSGPFHVMVSYAPGSLVCYRNGAPVKTVDTVKGTFANWTDAQLLIGGNRDGQRSWRGVVEGLAIYTRSVGADEARANSAAYLQRVKARKPATSVAVQAKLLSKTKIPTFEEIAPYTQTIVVYEYEVEKVLAGNCRDPVIRVGHFGMLDRKPLAIAKAEIGKSFRLSLEPYADHPELGGDQITDTLPVNPDPPFFYDVGPLGP